MPKSVFIKNGSTIRISDTEPVITFEDLPIEQ